MSRKLLSGWRVPPCPTCPLLHGVCKSEGSSNLRKGEPNTHERHSRIVFKGVISFISIRRRQLFSTTASFWNQSALMIVFLGLFCRIEAPVTDGSSVVLMPWPVFHLSTMRHIFHNLINCLTFGVPSQESMPKSAAFSSKESRIQKAAGLHAVANNSRQGRGRQENPLTPKLSRSTQLPSAQNREFPAYKATHGWFQISTSWKIQSIKLPWFFVGFGCMWCKQLWDISSSALQRGLLEKRPPASVQNGRESAQICATLAGVSFSLPWRCSFSILFFGSTT